MPHRIGPQRPTLHQPGSSQSLGIVLVSRKEQVVGCAAFNLGKQAPRGAEGKRHRIAGLLLELRDQVLQSVVEVSGRSHRQLLRWRQLQQKEHKEDMEEELSHTDKTRDSPIKAQIIATSARF